MANKKNGVEEYLHQVSQLLDCPSAKKKEILGQVRLSLQDIPGIENMTVEQILEIADSPEELAEAHMGKARIKKNAKLKRWLLLILAVCAVVIITLAAIFVVDTLKVNHGTFQETSAQSDIYHGASDAIETY